MIVTTAMLNATTAIASKPLPTRRRRFKVIPPPLSMVNPATDQLVKRTKSRYVLVMLARARELLSGATCKVPNHDNKYVTNAFEEINKKKISAKLPAEEEI